MNGEAVMVKRFTRADDIIWRQIGDEIVILREDGLGTHILNKMAAIIWEKCDGQRTIDEIVAGICERFEVSTEEASTDVNDTIEQMIQINIVNNIGDTEGK